MIMNVGNKCTENPSMEIFRKFWLTFSDILAGAGGGGGVGWGGGWEGGGEGGEALPPYRYLPTAKLLFSGLFAPEFL